MQSYNCRFLILCALYEATLRGLGCGLLYILSPSGRGKTTTKEIFQKDHVLSKTIKAGTEASIYAFLTKSLLNDGIMMLFVDDKTRWVRDDFGYAIGYGKMIGGDGVLGRLRNNFQTIEDEERKVTCSFVLILNPDQANSCSNKLKETGFLERALKLKVAHDADEYARIKRSYRAHGWGKSKLPSLRIPKNFFKPRDDNHIDEEIDQWIADYVKSEASDTVRLIAQVITKEAFDGLKDCMLSGITDREFKEEIRFDCDCDVCKREQQTELKPEVPLVHM